MKIAIRFGDNDFGNTFRGVLKALLDAHRHTGKLPSDKNKLCLMINEISYGCYLLYQNQFEYNEEKSGEACQRTKSYLQIKPERVLVNEEVDRYLETTDWDNSETFVLDTSLDYENNDPIYSV